MTSIKMDRYDQIDRYGQTGIDRVKLDRQIGMNRIIMDRYEKKKKLTHVDISKEKDTNRK